jgi:hypothetical protein
MICKLCNLNEATKKNTHYLTDSIIRSALNIDGSNSRDKGFYFDMSNDKPSVEFNFQRSTPMEKFELETGRQTSDEENEMAKEILFSVDNVFCPDCEKLFGEIETPFIENILPKLRNSNLDGLTELTFEQSKIIRLFFYLQIWRNAICEDIFIPNEQSMEKLSDFLKITIPLLAI